MFQWLSEKLILVELPGDGTLRVTLSILAVLIITAICTMIALAAYWGMNFRRWSEFEINEATLSIGDHRVKLKPNNLDRQIAYSIWVELSTRKIGLPLDPENDVITEIYDSWYHFFGISRELIKSIPVNKIRKSDTLKLIELSILVLNEGLRPHLTRWQSRFRHWEHEARKTYPDRSPQEIQRQYPDYEELITDMLAVNQSMQEFRSEMYRLAMQS